MPRPRLSMATVMILVITAASASALFSRLARHMHPTAALVRHDLAFLFVAAIVLTAMAIAARKSHSPRLAMLQITVACLAYLSLISVAEVTTGRPLFYWYQATFAVLVVIPLIARRIIKLRLEKGPRRAYLMKACESLAFAFLNMVLVLIGVGVQILIWASVTNLLKF